MFKTLNYNNTQIALKVSAYCNNNRVAIAMYELWDGHHEQYGVATVNLDDFLFGPNEAFMDENNHPGITQCFIEAGLAKPLNRVGYSGYCQYPVVELNLEEIAKYDCFPPIETEEEDDEWSDIEEEDNDDDFSFDAFLRDIEKEDF
jgi:hypothetical protein